MLRNYLAAALRNLARNKAFAALNFIGLAVGFGAGILALLYVRHETSYDRFIPDHARIHIVVSSVAGNFGDKTPAYFAEWLRTDFPGIEVARLYPQDLAVRRGEQEATEATAWGDADWLEMIKLPVVAGNLTEALTQPDAVAITRRIARKYFGQDLPLGETLELNRKHLVRVVAILEDLPAASHLQAQVFGSGRHPEFGLLQWDAQTPQQQGGNSPVFTYVRSAAIAGMSIADMQAALPEWSARRMRFITDHIKVEFRQDLVPLADLHLYPNHLSASHPHGNPMAVASIGAAGALVVLVAVINFAGLVAARSSRRVVEIGVRKISGALAAQIRSQFVGEAALHVLLALVVAVAAVTLAVPSVDARLAPGIAAQWPSGFVLFAVAILAGGASLLAGIYPALVALQRPAVSRVRADHRAARFRAGLVLVQFTVMIALIVATLVMTRQISFSLRDGLRVNRDQIMLIYAPCEGPFHRALAALPGVQQVACSNRDPLNFYGMTGATRRDGSMLSLGIAGVGWGYFDLYGVKPIAGRVFDEARDGDRVKDPRMQLVVLNESAVMELGFTSPEDAVGRSFAALENRDGPPSEIIGVVPDFTFDLKDRTPPIMFGGRVSTSNPVLNVKLAGASFPETHGAIDALWKRVGEPRPLRSMFVDQHLETSYVSVLRQQSFIGGLSLTAIVVACLGLFGLSAFAAEQRTKEIGIRKSMGATRMDILRLILWQFAKPVLWANIIAWPLAYLLMQRWLEGFAYRIDLAPWMFLAASALAFTIAMVTVIGHALLVARAKPVKALRYE